MGIKQVWKKVKELTKPHRQLLVITPNRNYMVELVAVAFEEPDTRRMTNRGTFCVQISYDDRAVKALVGNHQAADLVCRVKEQLLGRRDQDIVLVDPIAMGAALKHELQCLAATFEAKFTIVVDK